MKTPENTIIKTAYKIAKSNLESCIIDLGFICGLHHFTDLWARDSLFASFGGSLINKPDAAKKTIETFMSFQRADGLVPYRIQRSPTTISKYLGFPRYFKSPKANFRSHQTGGIVPDGGLMAIIALAEYIKTSKNISFLHKIYPEMEKNIAWYVNKFKSGLVSEWFMCEWQDAVLKAGKTIYTNTLYYKALSDFAFMSGFIDKAYKSKYKKLALSIKNKINQEFWNGQFYCDWIDYKKHNFFSSFANLLSVFWDIADKEQSQSILDFTGKYCLRKFTVAENYPKYPLWRIPFWNFLIGLSDYHNDSCLWLQPGIIYALCLNKTGKKQEAQEMLTSISRQIVKHQGVFEIYEKSGIPVNRIFYKSEHPFAWSSGLFIYAVYNIMGI